MWQEALSTWDTWSCLIGDRRRPRSVTYEGELKLRVPAPPYVESRLRNTTLWHLGLVAVRIAVPWGCRGELLPELGLRRRSVCPRNPQRLTVQTRAPASSVRCHSEWRVQSRICCCQNSQTDQTTPRITYISMFPSELLTKTFYEVKTARCRRVHRVHYVIRLGSR